MIPAEQLRNLREERAKQAYRLYQHRVGVTVPWEKLDSRNRQAWLEIERFLQDEPECSQCGDPLVCPDCDDIGPDCPFCGADMICPACDYAEKTDATEEPKPQSKP